MLLALFFFVKSNDDERAAQVEGEMVNEND